MNDPAPVPGCLFCAIVAGGVPADVVLETPGTVAFRDINPQAPTHVLVVPRAHHATAAELAAADPALTSQLVEACAAVADREGLQRGYRIVLNTGPDGGQDVRHVHAHVLGGRRMRWPPG